MTAVLSSALILSLAIFSTTQLTSAALAQQQNPKVLPAISALPFGKNSMFKFNATDPLFLPNLGRLKVWGPEGKFYPHEGPFKCNGGPECGVPAGKDSTFSGTLEQGNAHHMTNFTASFISPATGASFTKDHKYKIVANDFLWNISQSAEPTKQPAFSRVVNGVSICGTQHYASDYDASDVLQLFQCPGGHSYGHVSVEDMNGTVVGKHVFAHLMYGTLINGTDWYKWMRVTPLSGAPNPVAILILQSFPDEKTSPGHGTLGSAKIVMHNATEAQSYRPIGKLAGVGKPDFILEKSTHPPFNYPIAIPEGNKPGGKIESPGAMGSPQPDDIKGENFVFAFLVFTKPHGEWVNGTGTSK